MAGTKRSGNLGASMSRVEIIAGFLYLPLYVIGLSWLLSVIFSALGKPLSQATGNLLYFLINFVVIAVVFHRWLIASLQGISKRFWPFLQAVVLGFAFYYALTWATGIVLTLLDLYAVNPNNEMVEVLAGNNFKIVVVCSVLLAPIVEETLFRGLVFGNLHPHNRVAAYLVSSLLFAAIHVWQYVGEIGWIPVLLSALQYLPAGMALGWTYEKSNTIWAPILVHSLINAVSMGILHG